MNNQRGTMMVQVLLSFGLIAIMSLFTAMILANQQREMIKIRIRSDLIDIQNSIRVALSKSSSCVYNLSSLNMNTINSINANMTSIDLINGLKAGDQNNSPDLIKPGPDSPGLNGANVQSIKLNITGTPGDYIGEIVFSVKYRDFEFKPVKVSGISISTDNPVTQISSCSSQGGGGGGQSSISAATTQIVTGPNSACRGYSVATCPPGFKLISGGHRFLNSCGCSESHRFTVSSRPEGNSWTSKIECAKNQAFAVCMK